MKEIYKKWINRFPKIVGLLYAGLVIGLFMYLGIVFYKVAPNETITLKAWIIALAIASFGIKLFIAGYLVFGDMKLVN